MDNTNIPKLAQGAAKPADSIDLQHDATGITYPNLHRRIDNENTPLSGEEVAPDTYLLTVGGVNSYRTTTHTVYDEDSNDSEVP